MAIPLPRIGLPLSLTLPSSTAQCSCLRLLGGPASVTGRHSHSLVKKAFVCRARDRCVIHAEKNLKALKDILQRLPEGTRLCFVGDGPARAELEQHFTGQPVVFTVSA